MRKVYIALTFQNPDVHAYQGLINVNVDISARTNSFTASIYINLPNKYIIPQFYSSRHNY